MKIAINGFGRIGRSVFRILEEVEGVGGDHVQALFVDGEGVLDRLAFVLQLVAEELAGLPVAVAEEVAARHEP